MSKQARFFILVVCLAGLSPWRTESGPWKVSDWQGFGPISLRCIGIEAEGRVARDYWDHLRQLPFILIGIAELNFGERWP